MTNRYSFEITNLWGILKQLQNDGLLVFSFYYRQDYDPSIEAGLISSLNSKFYLLALYLFFIKTKYRAISLH